VSAVQTDIPAEAALLKRHGFDTVDGAFAFAGGEALTKPRLGSRERIRLSLAGDDGRPIVWYLKRYGADSWATRLCRRIFGGAGAARREFESICRLHAAGVPTMRAVAMGEAPGAFGPGRGYLVVTSVPGEALERCGEDFLARHAGDAQALDAFNDALADLASGLHAAGFTHRDFYASHIFLDPTPEGPRLYLIDLARVFHPRWCRFRWRVKDLAQLKYSMPPAWVGEHWGRFLSSYLGRTGDGPEDRYTRAINAKVARMRRRQDRHDRR